jgi:hypothetical protein
MMQDRVSHDFADALIAPIEARLAFALAREHTRRAFTELVIIAFKKDPFVYDIWLSVVMSAWAAEIVLAD